MPQLYWEHTHRVAPFSVLMPWWYGHCYKRHVYYGLGVYKMTDARSGPWAGKTGVNELLWQLRDIRKQCPNSGYCFYSASCFDKIKAPVKDSLIYGANKYPALVPAMEWLDSIPPAVPALKGDAKGNTVELKWTESNPQKEHLKFVVYRFVNGEPVNIDRNDKIVSLQQATEFKDMNAKQYKKVTYVVTALDRSWNESKPSNSFSQ
jgi:hypothetical protein